MAWLDHRSERRGCNSADDSEEPRVTAASDWIECMRRGDFTAAWKISDRVLHARAGVPCWHLPRHEQWIWNGQPLEGKRVLVRCYHGLGDTVQYLRYAPQLRRIAREVYLWVQPELIPLVEGVRGIDRVLPLHDGAPEIDYDADVEIMELAHVFRTVLATIPNDVPYLRVEPAELGPGTAPMQVGVVWRAGGWDVRRSLPLELVRPLAQIEGIELHA